MEVVWFVLFMVIIGAAIGGLTNSLAIKMLFRPYHAVKLGRFQIPFTPGLIPKRREELAVQLGDMVVKHLITKEGLQKKITESRFQSDLMVWVHAEVEAQLNSDKSLNELTKDFFQEHPLDDILASKLKTFLQDHISTLILYYQDQPLKNVCPDALKLRVESYIPKTARFIQSRLIEFVESEEGKTQLKELLDEFLSGRGMLGNMINMFLGNESLTDKVQMELVKILQKEAVTTMLGRVLTKEWKRLLERPLDDLTQVEKWEETKNAAVVWMVSQVNPKEIINKPLHELTGPYQSYIKETLLPKIVNRSLYWVGEQIEIVMEKLQLSGLVREQVQTFSVQRLEEMVLSISKKELKMITYLGALLGGVIGFIQSLLVYFII